MSKLVILFVCVAVFAYANGALVKRDAPPSGEQATKALENAFHQVEDFFKNTFSEDQLKKFGKELQDLSEKVQSGGKEFLEQAEEKIKKLQEASDKKPE